jgi:glycerophosphoryl diester phosphodiesterase
MFNMSLFSSAVFAALLTSELAFAQVTIENRLAPGQPLVVIAHRAVFGGALDNSLAGIQYAIDRGIDMVEIDVQRTHGGGYVLMHDSTLLSRTNVAEVYPEGSPQRDPEDARAREYFVSDHTLRDIARLRLRDPQGDDYPVPTLDETLELAEGRLLMIVHLKRWDIDSLVPLLKTYDGRNLLVFSQVFRRRLQETAVATGIGVYASLSSRADISSGLDEAIEIHGSSLKMVGVKSEALTPEFVAKAEALGVRVNVDGRFFEVLQSDGTVEPWLKTTIYNGAAAVMTRQPNELLELLGR